MRMVMRLACVAALSAACSVAVAAPVQLLLAEDFESVTGINAAATVRTVGSIPASELSGSPSVAFSNTGNGNASANAFNVRRGDNAIDGNAGVPTLGNVNFDNFFGPAANQFLVVGDDSGNLGSTPNGGTNAAASSTMSISFALAPITLGSPDVLRIGFDYVFDANDVANPDDFLVELLLADTTAMTLLSLAAPDASTRGSFSSSIQYASLSAAPQSLRFTLVEGRNNGSSAVGLDNLRVEAVPEPGVLALVAIALLGAGVAGRRRA